MTQDKLKELKEVIVKANPEIMELKFGCELEIDWTGDGVEHQVRFFGDEMRDNGDNTVIEDNVVGHIGEILGRPITLADTIIAILEFDTKTPLTKTAELLGLVCMQWNLKENLNNQSTECIEWLWSLLVKE